MHISPSFLDVIGGINSWSGRATVILMGDAVSFACGTSAFPVIVLLLLSQRVSTAPEPVEYIAWLI